MGSVPVRTKDSPTDLLFSALANPTRRDILLLLLEGPRTAGEIAERYDMARPSVSEHLKVLLDRGLVSEEKLGRTVRYSVTPEPLAAVASWLSPFEAFWRGRLKDLHTTLANLKDT
jgi:DNA-binding transcriptional ArsR family regulator